MAWEFKREESKGGFTPLPVGDYRIRIKNAEKAVAKTGKDMLSLTFEVSGHKNKIFHNIVFLPDRPEITNRNLTDLFDSFKDIPEGDFNLQNWVGKVGACRVKHEEYNGNTNAVIHYFIKADKQASLPAWVEPESASDIKEDDKGFLKVPEGVDADLPF